MALPRELPERLEADLVSEGTSESTGAKRQVWSNKEFDITLIVTWAPPRMNIGIQQFSSKHLPGWQFTNYEALRQTWVEQKVGAK